MNVLTCSTYIIKLFQSVILICHFLVTNVFLLTVITRTQVAIKHRNTATDSSVYVF